MIHRASLYIQNMLQIVFFKLWSLFHASCRLTEPSLHTFGYHAPLPLPPPPPAALPCSPLRRGGTSDLPPPPSSVRSLQIRRALTHNLHTLRQGHPHLRVQSVQPRLRQARRKCNVLPSELGPMPAPSSPPGIGGISCGETVLDLTEKMSEENNFAEVIFSILFPLNSCFLNAYY